MADSLQTLLSFPPDQVDGLSAKQYDARISSHLKDLKRIPSASWTKKYDRQELIDLLDPAVNSIAYNYALLELIAAHSQDPKRWDQLIFHAVAFLTSFDPVQVRYAGDNWRLLFEWTAEYLSQHATPDVSALSTAILRLDPTAGTFTTNHLRFVQVCLSCRVPSQALPVLDRDIYAYPQKAVKNVPEELPSEDHELSNAYITDKSGLSGQCDAVDVLQYHLLGAQIYIALHNYSRARLFLECVLLAPSQQHTASMLQVEAYKKWLLLGMLAEGKAYPTPKTMDQSIWKSVKACSKPYEALEDAFAKREVAKLAAEVQTGRDVWTDDGNVRLVTEVSDAVQRHRVIDLERTYAALPVTRVASLLDAPPAETLQHVQNMIRGGHLHASVSGSGNDAVLRFHASTAPATAEIDLAAPTERIQGLVAFIRDADRRLQLTREYVEHQKRQKRSAGADGDLADVMDLSWDAPSASNPIDEDDEDIMAS